LDSLGETNLNRSDDSLSDGKHVCGGDLGKNNYTVKQIAAAETEGRVGL